MAEKNINKNAEPTKISIDKTNKNTEPTKIRIDKTSKATVTVKSTSKRETLCDDIAGKGCGLKKVLDIIGGKWKIMLLCVMDQEGQIRYGELKRKVFGITNTMLANSLKEMEETGLVERHQFNEMPVRVEYSLTDKARSIVPILLELKKWGEENL